MWEGHIGRMQALKSQERWCHVSKDIGEGRFESRVHLGFPDAGARNVTYRALHLMELLIDQLSFSVGLLAMLGQWFLSGYPKTHREMPLIYVNFHVIMICLTLLLIFEGRPSPHGRSSQSVTSNLYAFAHASFASLFRSLALLSPVLPLAKEDTSECKRSLGLGA